MCQRDMAATDSFGLAGGARGKRQGTNVVWPDLNAHVARRLRLERAQRTCDTRRRKKKEEEKEKEEKRKEEKKNGGGVEK